MGKHSADDSVTELIPVVKDGGFMSPTQVEHSWKATIRTAFQVILALAVIAPLVVPAVGLSTTVGVGAIVVAASAAIAKVMAIPGVNDFVDRFVPWLRAQ